jgi:peroxiredoxin Q/BCP
LKPLDVGDTVPAFELPDQTGALFRWHDALAALPERGAVVVFFYPQDETIVCTKEACGFRDFYKDFTALGASVIGISSDSVSSHRSFADNHKLPYTLLADVDDKVRDGVFRVPGGLLGLRKGRATYVMDKAGVVRHRYQKHLVAQEHVDGALAAVRQIR